MVMRPHHMIVDVGIRLLFLVVGFFMSSSAQSVEECRPLVTPLPTFEPSYGKWIFIMGWIDSEPFKVLFRSAKSQWINFRETPGQPKELVEDIGIRHPTYCKYGSSPVTLHMNTAVTDKTNFSCTYHSLPTCEGCLLYTVHSRNNNNLLPIMNITNPTTIHEVKGYRAFYLMAKENHVKHYDMMHTMKQARCLGFTGEPDFIYNPENSLCSNDDDNDDDD
ncbi:uncharacterized protein LOC132991113 isoform X2 [Labrus mixtus]|uniref:uncharacterized protein LOC132991113 isoform X2 n=1 Tax=Labrus mixtus TaxID=508554 RepID=UPI0029C0CBD8|nr:uncharacterized protein LOC132991113 isoform X2 [Labrus mixtus]